MRQSSNRAEQDCVPLQLMVCISKETTLLTVMAFRGHCGKDHACEFYVGQHGASLGKAAGDKIREGLHTFNYLGKVFK